jgi:23S rRNA-/tRNA-specific pseudouridylate synthase
MANPRIEVEERGHLMDVLSILYPEAKKNSLRRMIDHGRVLIDGNKASRAKEIVRAGSTVETLSRSEGDGPARKKVDSIPEDRKSVV